LQNILPKFFLQVSVKEDGTIVGLKASMFCDPGCTPNESTVLLAMICMQK